MSTDLSHVTDNSQADAGLLTGVHRRYNPLRRSWVLCSPHRTARPWQGDEERVADAKPPYDPKCYLCPGNTRAGGQSNPKYDSTFIFTNDFAAVVTSADSHDPLPLSDGLFQADAVRGSCVVVCFSPSHNVTLANMSSEAISGVIDAWKQIYLQAVARPEVVYCQIFENKGAAMGCSNPHPHGQAWMTNIVPDEPQIEHDALAAYYAKHRRHMLEDYVAAEVAKGQRIIDSNNTFVVIVPFWATWPFETLLVSRRRIRSVADLSPSEQKDLAHMLHSITVRYDNLFKTSFPYSMGIHQAFTTPYSDESDDVEHLLFHFYPPLLRSATVRKFLVGFEMLGMPQRDITPETAADALRAQPVTHYLNAEKSDTANSV